MSLPAETRAYVPKLLALSRLVLELREAQPSNATATPALVSCPSTLVPGARLDSASPVCPDSCVQVNSIGGQKFP